MLTRSQSCEGPSRSRDDDLPLVSLRSASNPPQKLYGCPDAAKSAACLGEDTQNVVICDSHLQPELSTPFHSSTPNWALLAVLCCIMYQAAGCLAIPEPIAEPYSRFLTP
ncbi:hypothetical protein CGRA01v4_11394 [Colletotrichum graminicola]|nr:hypothetical protein CGRA01v4_11394 [Colletotrichum graminicola]